MPDISMNREQRDRDMEGEQRTDLRSINRLVNFSSVNVLRYRKVILREETLHT